MIRPLIVVHLGSVGRCPGFLPEPRSLQERFEVMKRVAYAEFDITKPQPQSGWSVLDQTFQVVDSAVTVS